MIFITLGSQKFQFNRLLKAVDKLVEDKIILEDIFAQTGYSDYRPEHYEYKPFLNHDEFSDMEARADIVITHGGTGAIMGAVKKEKKVIAVPRLSKYGEHVDDHQMQLLKEFDRMGIILVCYDIDQLGKLYKEIGTVKLNSYISNQKTIFESIDEFLKEI